jgi:hypothetical protein
MHVTFFVLILCYRVPVWIGDFMRQVIFAKTRITHSLHNLQRNTLPTGEPTATSVVDGLEEVYYETSLDLDALHLMAHTAAATRSGVCDEGPVRVRIVERRRLP